MPTTHLILQFSESPRALASVRWIWYHIKCCGPALARGVQRVPSGRAVRFDSKAAHGRSLAILTPMNVLLQTAPIILLSFLVKIGVDALPGAAVRLAFAAIPARLAAFYWGVPLCPDDLSFSVQGLTFVVARSCAATDFFSMAAPCSSGSAFGGSAGLGFAPVGALAAFVRPGARRFSPMRCG